MIRLPLNRVRGRHRRRGVVAVQVAVILTVILGFAALTVDVGAMYNTKADLQRTVDSAALAAAAMLAEYDGDAPPADLARAAALAYTEQNPVLNRDVTLDTDTDVVFGRAVYDAQNNEYTFTPTDTSPDAVQVTLRKTADSPNGPVLLYFARIFGLQQTEMTVSATAIMVPRDIAIVADLSGSHNDDSSLQAYADMDINLWDVWDNFPGGIDEAGGSWNPDEVPPDWFDEDGFAPQAAGPAWGYMKTLGYGTDPITESYDPAADPGLVYLPYNVAWSNADLSAYLTERGYNATEVSAIMSKSFDGSGAWPNRVAVALGLAYWNSGIPGGLWETRGAPAGNANSNVGSTELEWSETFGDRSIAQCDDIWKDWINYYMKSTSTAMYQANSKFRYRFGVKTFINYLMERRPTHNQTPELADTPHQPMQAVKDAAGVITAKLEDLDTDDQLSLEVYGTTAYHEVDLTHEVTQVSDRLAQMQAAHYDGWTNIGGGLGKGIEELTSERARSASRKMIILLTDGIANVTESGAVGDEEGGAAYALEMAQEAADLGIVIFAVAVGNAADHEIMQQIADIGAGEFFYANGSVDEYSAELAEIFDRLGGQRPVELIR